MIKNRSKLNVDTKTDDQMKIHIKMDRYQNLDHIIHHSVITKQIEHFYYYSDR